MSLRSQSCARLLGWLLFFVAFSPSMMAHAATITWNGNGTDGTCGGGAGDGNKWTCGANWSGGVPPGTADVATFNNTSIKDATINSNIDVRGINIQGGASAYTGTITQATGVTITVGYNCWTQASGTFNGGDSSITFNSSTAFSLTGGTFNATTGNLYTTANAVDWTVSGGTFNAGTGTVVIRDIGTMTGSITLNNVVSQAATGVSYASIAAGTTVTVNGTLTFDDTGATSGSGYFGSGTLEAKGNIVVADTNDYRYGDKTLLINGSGNQELSCSATQTAGAMPVFNINKSSGTLTITGTCRKVSYLYYTAGAIDGSGTIVVGGSPTIDATPSATDTVTLPNVIVEYTSTAYVQNPTTLVVTGTLTYDRSGSGNGGLQCLGGSSCAIHVKGNLEVADTNDYYTNNIPITINGTGTQTFTGNATAAAGTIPPITINKAAGTLNFAGIVRTVRNWTYTAGTIGGTGTIVFSSNNSSVTIAGSHNLPNVTFNMDTYCCNDSSATTISAGTILTVDGLLTIDRTDDNLMNIDTGTIHAKGDVTVTNGGTRGSALLVINGTGNQTLTGSGSLAAYNGKRREMLKTEINKASGTLYLASILRTDRDWTYTAGTVDACTYNSTVAFSANEESPSELLITGTHALCNVTMIRDEDGGNSNSVTIAGGSTLTVNGTLTIDRPSATTYGFTLPSGTVHAKGDVTVLGKGIVSGGMDIVINGTGTQTLTGAGSLTEGSLPSVEINKPSGTLNLASVIRVETNWTYTAGTLNPGTSTVVFSMDTEAPVEGTITGSHTLNNVQFRRDSSCCNANSVTIAAGTTLTVGGALTFNRAVSDGLNVEGPGTLLANGNVTMSGSNNVAGSVVLTFAGSGVQSFNLTGSEALLDVDLKVDKTGGAVNLGSNLTMDATNQDLTITQGTFDLSGYSATRSGSGTTFVVQSSGNLQLQGNETFTVPTLDAGSTVTYDGSGTYTALVVGSTYSNLTFNGTGTWTPLTDLTVNGTLTVTAGTLKQTTAKITAGGASIGASGIWKNSSSGDITFGTGNLFNAGTFHLNGGSGQCDANPILVNSSAASSSWSGGGVYEIQDVDLQNQVASVAITAYSSTDSGGNTGSWTWSGTCGFNDFRIWGGGLNSPPTGIWNVANNWTGNVVPSAGDAVQFSSTSSTDCAVDVNVNVETFEITSGYAGTITQNSGITITVGTAGFSQAGGTFTGGNSKIDVAGSFTLSGGVFNATSDVLEVSGALSKTGGTFNAGTGTVTLDSTVGQTLGSALTFNHLTLKDLSLTSGLIGYWKLDETSGTSAADSSGNGKTGTHTNTPTISTTVSPASYPNPNARSLYFTGGAGADLDYVDVPAQNAIAGSTTWAAWVYYDAASFAGNYNTIIEFGNDSPVLYARSDGRVQRYGGATSWVGALTVGRWAHIAYTWNGTNEYIFLNGVQITSGSTGPSTSGVGMGIGYHSGDTPWKGYIDDVRVYNRALSVDEIKALAGLTSRTAGVTYTLGAPLDVNGDLTIELAKLDVGGSNYAINLGGSWLMNGGLFAARTGTVTLDGTSAGKTLRGAGIPFGNLTVNGAAGGWTLGWNLDVNGTLAVSNGTLDVSASNYRINAWTVNQTGGTITPQSGTIVLDAPSNQTVRTTSTLNNLNAGSITEDGLVGYWRLDETSGTTAADSSGSGLTGTLTNGPTPSTTVPTAIQFPDLRSLDFNGSTQYVNLGTTYPPLPADQAPRSMCGWARTDTTAAGYRWIVAYGYNTTSQAMFIGLNGTTLVSGGYGDDLSSNNFWAVGTWKHVCLTYDGTNARLYGNGSLVAGPTAKTWTLRPRRSYIGRQVNDSEYWDGLIDDVRIYNRELSATEVTNLYNGYFADGTGNATFTLGANLQAAALSVDMSTFNAGGYAVTLSNLLTMANGTYQASTATQTFNGGLTVSAGTFTGAGGTVDVNGNVTISGGTLTAPSGMMIVSGNWSKMGGTFASNGGTVTFDASSGNQTLASGGTDAGSDFDNLTVSKSSGSLQPGTNDLKVNGTLAVSLGTFEQGTTNVEMGTLSVSSGATYRNESTGDLTLGAGGVSNAGTVLLDGSGGGCGSTPDEIAIQRCGICGGQTPWSGAGTFTIYDVTPSNQGGSILAASSTDGGGNAWQITSGCSTIAVWTNGGSCNGNWNDANCWSPSAPTSNDIARFNSTYTANCTVNVGASVAGLEVLSGYTGTLTVGSGNTLTVGSSDLTQAAGIVSVSGTLQLDDAGTIQSGGDLRLAGSGAFKLADTSVFQVDYHATTPGVFRATSASQTVTKKAAGAGGFTFRIYGKADITGLTFDYAGTNGLELGNGTNNPTVTNLRNVTFQNHSGAGSTFMTIRANGGFSMSAAGITFGAITAGNNVKLLDNDGQLSGATVFATFGASGAGKGDTYEVDNDSTEDGTPDTAGGSTVIQWTSSGFVLDGAATGFPTRAFDWNTYAAYAVYVAAKDVGGGASTSDRVYVRDQSGNALYSYDIADADGDILGTPIWDTKSETVFGPCDMNNDGDSTDSLHVVYVATGKPDPGSVAEIFLLVDTGSALQLPKSGCPWQAPYVHTNVDEITSPLIYDTNNLYFGGENASDSPRVFGVQIADTDTTPNAPVLQANPVSRVETAPAWRDFSGTVYLYMGSRSSVACPGAGQAYAYRVDTTGGGNPPESSSTAPRHDVNGNISLVSTRMYMGDDGGRMHGLDASSGLANLGGYPYRDTDPSRHSEADLDNCTYPITAAPYVTWGSWKVSYGDADGHFYVLNSTAAPLSGYPFRPGGSTAAFTNGGLSISGVIVAGNANGKVYYINESAASVFKTYDFGSGVVISQVAYQSGLQKFMIGTSDGGLYFLNKETPP